MIISKILRIAVTLFAIVIAVPSSATITSVTASPNPVGINTQGTTFLTLNYTIQITAPGVTVFSPTGTLFIDAVAVAVPGGLISQTVSAGGSTTVRMRERIRISRDLAAQIAQGTSINFQREFNDGGGIFLIVVTIVPSSSGALSFRNISLSFDDRSRFRTVPQNGAITAIMRLTTSGRGLLDGNWQVSGPSGQNSFYPIGRVRQTLAGQRSIVIESPTLPTDQPGIYTVRFVPSGPPDPELTAAFSEIRYSVLPASGQATIELLAPAVGVNIGTATAFSWQGLANVAAYRVEFLSLAAGSLNDQPTRVAAIDVLSSQTSASLKPFTLARIHAARGVVYWRILGLDGNGAVIAASSIRPVGD